MSMSYWSESVTLKNGATVAMQKALLMTLIMLGLTGCSNRAVYDNIRAIQRDECLKEPQSSYSECIERTNKSYDEYERERKELLEDESKNSEDK